MNAEKLFAAKRIALVGASPKTVFSRRVLSNLSLLRFPDDQLFLVNPNYSAIGNRPCYPDLKQVPGPVDVALILTPKAFVPAVLRDAVAAGVKGSVVVASGFAEAGEDGAELQRQMAQIAGDEMAICGPNTMGLASFADGVALFTGDMPANVVKGQLSAVFQSGGMLNVFLQVCAYRRIGLNRLTVTGNEAVTTLSDYLVYYAQDPETSLVAVHVESIREGDKFRAALEECRKNGKPVVVLLIGKSARARQSVQAHSGNLVAGSKWGEALKGFGAIVVNNLDDMVNACSLLSRSDARGLSGGVQLATVSGGDCGWLSDLADNADLELPDFPEPVRQALKPILRKEQFTDNPLDVGGLPRSGDDRLERTIEAACQSPHFSLIALRLNYPSPCTETAATPYRVAAAAARRHGKQPVFLTRASEALGDDWMQLFDELKAPFLLEYERGLRAIKMVQDYYQARAMTQSRREIPANSAALAWLSTRRGTLSFAAAAELAAYYGIPVLPYMIVDSSVAAVAAAHALRLPVALKVDSRAIPHKTDAGVVALGLETEEKVLGAYDTIVSNAQQITGEPFSIIVQPMVQGGVEMLLGIVNDPDMGPLIVVALGGIFTELFRDIAIRPVPVSKDEAYRMVLSLKGKDLLLGARGRPEADVEEFARVVEQLSLLARDNSARIKELDLNPVMVLPKGQGVKAVDLLVVLMD